MLIEFNVTNFRSLRDRQTFSLMANTQKELIETNTFKTTAHNEFHLLRSATIYGANASGKSNVLKALNAMRRIVLRSASSQHGDSLKVVPFRLNSKSRYEPCEFEVTFIVDKVRYQYGFSATAERIHDEWLLAYPKGRPQQWFGRAWNEEKNAYDWQLGGNLTGEKHLWQKSTRDNALFLSTAVQLNSEQLQPIYDWFKKTLRICDTDGWGHGFSASLCEKNEKTQMMDYLRAADLNIEDILVENEPMQPLDLPKGTPENVKSALTLLAEDIEERQVLRTVHKDNDNNLVPFDFDNDESEGTQRLFSFAGPWIDSLANGYILFVDELHNSLHPKLVKFLVSLFHSEKTNPKNAQLVFTTHETSILNQEVFRRDQIWFCEKDKEQATTLYPLSDFKPRKDQNLELAYLSGRFGALPYVKSLKG